MLTIGDRRVTAKGAYLVVTPPNYGPALDAGPISLLDQVRSPLTFAGMIPMAPVTFRETSSRSSNGSWICSG